MQSAHAAIEYYLAHPQVPHETLVFLVTGDETGLFFLLDCAQRAGAEATSFHEPSLGGALTAVAIGDSRAARRLTAGFPLAPTGQREEVN